MAAYIKLDDGSEVDRDFFNARLKELKKEKWSAKDISELCIDHVNCELTFETISISTSQNYYQSDQGSIISVKAFEKYIKDKH